MDKFSIPSVLGLVINKHEDVNSCSMAIENNPFKIHIEAREMP